MGTYQKFVAASIGEIQKEGGGGGGGGGGKKKKKG